MVLLTELYSYIRLWCCSYVWHHKYVAQCSTLVCTFLLSSMCWTESALTVTNVATYVVTYIILLLYCCMSFYIIVYIHTCVYVAQYIVHTVHPYSVMCVL